MYTQRKGRREIVRIGAELAQDDHYDLKAVTRVRFRVQSGVHRILARNDFGRVNKAVPFIELERIKGERSSFSMVVLSPYDPDDEDDEMKAAIRAFDVARRLTVSLSIAGRGLFVWRALRVGPAEMGVLLPGDVEEREIEIERNYIEYVDAPQLHAGFLAASLETMRGLHEQGVESRFHEIYQRGCEFMSAGGDTFGSFFEEALLCFYRCLEYIATSRILHRKRRYKAVDLVDATHSVGGRPPRPDELKQFASLLERVRGSRAAHLSRKTASGSVSPLQLKALKDTLDNLTWQWLRKQGRRSAAGSRSA